MRRSDDGGRTFERLPWTASDARCGEAVVAPDFLANETGYLLLEDGSVLRTADGGGPGPGAPRCRHAGRGWERSRPQTSPSPARVDGVAATAQGRLYRTTDAAVSWTLVRDDAGGDRGRPLRHSHGRVRGRGADRVLRTEDGGATWEQLANRAGSLARSAAWTRFTCLATTPSGQSLMRTTDGGVTFTSVSPSSTKLLAAAFAVGPARRRGGRGRRHRGVRRRRRDLGAGRGAPARRPSPASGRCPRHWCSRLGRTGRSRARPTAVALVRARRLHLRGRDRRLLRRRLRRLRGRRRRHRAAHRQRRYLVADPEHRLLRDAAGGAGARTPNGAPDRRPRVLRSTDGGNTFSRVRARIVAAARLFNVDRAGGRVFAYGSKNIVASSDRGRTWKKVLRPRKALLASLDFVSARTGFVLGQDGQVFKTAQRRAPLGGSVRGRLRRRDRHGVQQRSRAAT